MINSDCLVDRLNDLAANADEPSYAMTRTAGVGTTLTAAEFNELSSKVAWLSQNRYVADYDDPDSLVGYRAATVSADAGVTNLRLREVDRALARMRYVRRDVSWADGRTVDVAVTHATPSDARFDRAYALAAQYWGRDESTAEGNYGIVAATSTTAAAPSCMTRFKRASGALEVRTARRTASPTFDFTPYDLAMSARLFVRATTANPEDTPVDVARPRIAFSDVLGTGYGDWGLVAEIEPTATPWAGDPLPEEDADEAPDDAPIGYPQADGDERAKSWIVTGAVVLIDVSAAVGGCAD